MTIIYRLPLTELNNFLSVSNKSLTNPLRSQIYPMNMNIGIAIKTSLLKPPRRL